jgi:hypothetical protein
MEKIRRGIEVRIFVPAEFRSIAVYDTSGETQGRTL